ncbi:MAG: type II toxin-antitoxin system VapC family toxin [Deltaproteobacteria bacterium]|nr:MAG: type II toxin-antitoxin system VapC family toxin [Deltaproteobacteria bacterium]
MTATSYRYLLDTNIVSEIVRNPHGAVTRRIARVGEERVCTSIIVACELRYGAAKKASLRLGEQLEAVLAALPIVALERDADRHYGEIRADLERRGKPIGPNDLLIAAQARSLGLVLVTDNVREFGRVRDLDVKNWLPQ